MGVKTMNKVHIQWNENCVREWDAPVTDEALIKSKYNKHLEGGWRISLDYKVKVEQTFYWGLEI